MKKETFLPIFSGFYNTIFDHSDSMIECDIQCENEFKDNYTELFEVGISYEYYLQNNWKYRDYKNYYIECSKKITDNLTTLDHCNIIKSVKFQKLISPKYYNFHNDSINCIIDFNSRKLKKYLSENLESFKQYIKDRYTSRSGFISYYSNDYNDWLDIKNYNAHQIGSVLNFVLENENNEAEYLLMENSNLHEVWLNLDTEKMIKDFSNKKAV